MLPAKGPKQPATVTTMRMKRLRHGENAEYAGGAPAFFSGSEVGPVGGGGTLVTAVIGTPCEDIVESLMGVAVPDVDGLESAIFVENSSKN